MMCQRTGFPPISIIGLGFKLVSSESRVPSPPAKITAFKLTSNQIGFDHIPSFLNPQETVASGG